MSPAQQALSRQSEHAGPRQALDSALAVARSGDLSQAVALGRGIVERSPDNADALHFLGFVLHQTGAYDEAAGLIARSVALNDTNPSAHNNLGGALAGLGRMDEAEASYARALELAPDFADAHFNIGTAWQGQGRFEEAVAAYRAALELNPDFFGALHNLGASLIELGRYDEGEAACRRAVGLAPGDPDALGNLATVLAAQERRDEARAVYQRAIELDPENACQLANLGGLLGECYRPAEAIEILERAVAADPGSAEAHNGLGSRLREQGRAAEAAKSYRAALAADPALAMAHSNLLYTMNADTEVPAQEIFEESRRWDAAHAVPPSGAAPSHANLPDPGRRLRLGYVSPDFCDHTVAHFLEPLLAAHDRAAVEVFCYADVRRPDAMTGRFQEIADHWRSLVGLSDEAAAARIREDGIDILVDLAGHTAGNRLKLFARRPAPVQATWLGYPGSTGMAAMDYRLTDEIADPEGVADALHSETPIRLDGGFLCYQPLADAPEPAPAPFEAEGYVTFGSFNALSKLTAEVAETWTDILDAVPGSRLVLKDRALGEAATRQRIVGLFRTAGANVDRLELLPAAITRAEHLALYGRIDIALDPFPYGGTGTSCEALWMGVPLVTLYGDRHASRVGASLLARVGLDDLVADSIDGYIEQAENLAADGARLAGLRAELRQRMADSPLTDAAGFATRIEAAYREMWRRWCETAG